MITIGKIKYVIVISINSSQKGRARKISHPVIRDSYKIPGKSTANQIKKKFKLRLVRRAS